MKLAEALILRADCQKRIEQLKERLTRSAKVQEGEQPPEDPPALITELDTTISQLLELIKKINKTNSQTVLTNSKTISDALAERDTLMLKRNVYSVLITKSSEKSYRYSRSEIKVLNTVNVTEMQKQVDIMSRQYRELDTKIQAANWNTELIE